MSKCPKCRHENAEGTPLCRECGADIPLSAAQEPAEEPTSGAKTVDDEVLELMRNRRKIEAIKVYRERCGVGLKEAKEAVETLAAEQGVSQSAGCAGVVLFGLVVLAGGALRLLA